MKISKILLAGVLLSQFAHAEDPLFFNQWGLRNNGQTLFRAAGDIKQDKIVGIPGTDINWPGLEALEKLGSQEVIVAVIDSGMDMTHSDFKDRLYKGRDFLENTDTVTDDTGHGTHVAGIIAANADGLGTQGVTPSQIKILPLKVLNKDTTSFVYKGRIITDVIANAIAYAIEAKVSVINMSLGWPQLINTPKIIKTLDAAAEKGIVLVAASGNNNKDVPTWPCAHPAVICVGAMDNQGKITEFSNHGGKVDLVAPGEWIVSTIPRALESRTLRIQGYEAKNGSSQAAPFVTAAAALIKLQNPSFTAKEIKARLYSSAKKLSNDVDGRFVRFGSLSIQDALNETSSSMASVLVKDLFTVSVDREGSYNFTLPIEILGSSESEIQVSIEGLEASTRIEGTKLLISGKIPDLLRDSDIPVVFKTTINGKTTSTPTTLSFARNLKSEDFIKVNISDIPFPTLVSQQGSLKASRIGNVSVEDPSDFDFHGFIQTKKGDEFQITSLRANADSKEVLQTKITLTGHSQVLSVFEKDVNLDGKNDFIFYTLSAKRDNLHLIFTDAEGKPLFGKNSRWDMPITTFEGLPLKGGESADFAWIKMKTFLGEILVPYYQKSWTMPDLDNSKNILDRETGTANRLYYWEPYLKDNLTLARPRVIDSVDFKNKLQKSLKASSRDELSIDHILPQTTIEKKNGTVRHLLSMGEGFNKKSWILTLKDAKTTSLESYNDNDVYLVGGNLIQTRSIDDYSVSPNAFQMMLLDRANARVKPFVEGLQLPAWTLNTSGWNNPFFEIVGSFEKDDRRVLFFESRYHVYAYDQNGNTGTPKPMRLPINRDSSFPGVSFSETLQNVVVRESDKNQPAVSVNSTLIYGDRLYTMVSNGESFKRPISLSVTIPSTCAPLKSTYLAKTHNFSSYVMVCQEKTGVVLAFWPLWHRYF